MATKKKMLQAAAGSATGGGGAGLDITDVFSTYLYEGTGSARTITNDIDLDGEGGLVWVKSREAGVPHAFFDTERGVQKYIMSSSALGELTASDSVVSFNSNGFDLGADTISGAVNWSNFRFASWTFRKAPKFFDVVTYTGNGVEGRTVSHNLGVAPAFIIIKKTSGAEDWLVGTDFTSTNFKNLKLNTTDGATTQSYTSQYNSFMAQPNSTEITLSSVSTVNGSGETYVAYLFAHNDGDGTFGPDGDQDIIKCGSYTGNGSTSNGPIVDLGFEPQWLLIKNASATANWYIYDAMRGWPVDSSVTTLLRPDTSEAELGGAWAANNITPTGFQVRNNDYHFNKNGSTYIYIAIRRGPLAPPESATEVFDAKLVNSTSEYSVGFPSDFVIQKERASTYTWNVGSRLTGNDKYLNTNNTDSEKDYSPYGNAFGFDAVTGYFSSDLVSSSSSILHHFKRAPNFFDVVAYTGNGTAGRTVSHNLGVAPEMMWIKCRNTSDSWVVYAAPVFGQTGFDLLSLSDSDALPRYTNNVFSSTPVSDTSFNLGSYTGLSNGAGNNYIAYLFASLPGISKVGSFTAPSISNLTVDCGFSSGSRFVLIKSADSSGNWIVYDTARGITVGNDPQLSLNTTNAESTSGDFLYNISSGFVIETGVLVAGETYIFYAIA